MAFQYSPLEEGEEIYLLPGARMEHFTMGTLNNIRLCPYTIVSRNLDDNHQHEILLHPAQASVYQSFGGGVCLIPKADIDRIFIHRPTSID